jgi:hypothetical protein
MIYFARQMALKREHFKFGIQKSPVMKNLFLNLSVIFISQSFSQ